MNDYFFQLPEKNKIILHPKKKKITEKKDKKESKQQKKKKPHYITQIGLFAFNYLDVSLFWVGFFCGRWGVFYSLRCRYCK